MRSTCTLCGKSIRNSWSRQVMDAAGIGAGETRHCLHALPIGNRHELALVLAILAASAIAALEGQWRGQSGARSPRHTSDDRRRRLGAEGDIISYLAGRAIALPEGRRLARDGAVGVIDRSQDARHSAGPVASQAATLFGTRGAENHLGRDHVRPRPQAGHMIASDPTHTLTSSRRPGAVHIWLPATRSVLWPG